MDITIHCVYLLSPYSTSLSKAAHHLGIYPKKKEKKKRDVRWHLRNGTCCARLVSWLLRLPHWWQQGPAHPQQEGRRRLCQYPGHPAAAGRRGSAPATPPTPISLVQLRERDLVQPEARLGGRLGPEPGEVGEGGHPGQIACHRRSHTQVPQREFGGDH